ncbi:MAG: glycoside hydrolase family 3 C-terminal domain-containing protein [Clostridia bacterium]|nr:glycoside hydrolase family 3 C-terminal domain-containing protein [Clostridia bacterium]
MRKGKQNGMDFQEAVNMYRADPTAGTLRRAASLLREEMTTAEKLRLLQGRAMGVTAKNFLTKGRYYNGEAYPAGGCKRLGVPPVLFTDGPRGIVMRHGTCFPVPMLRGASFDDELEYRIGLAMADEAVAGGANLFAGICINLLRQPMWGRAQETYGEDPYLLGRMGAALTRAMQESGVIACPKHYALNSIEDLRFSVNAVCDDAALYDVYLPHFKKCIDAGAMSIMGAYNRVNGTYCCENERLLTDILRGEWGFEGFTLSDFVFGIYDGPRSLAAGMDVEMPYLFRYALLGAALRKGKITMAQVDRAAERVLRALIATLPRQKEAPQNVILSPAHIALAREAAVRGTVLLQNRDGVLPLPENAKIAVVGRYADTKNVGDHGSSQVYSPYTVTPYEGLQKRLGKENAVCYNGCRVKKAVAAAKDCDYIVACVGSDWLQEGEFLVNMGDIKKKPRGSGGDRADLRLPPEDVALIRALAKTGKKLIVNVMGGSAFVIREWSGLADAILMSFYSGMEGGNALADILSGDENPGGRLPFTIAEKEADYPSFLHVGSENKDIRYGYYHGYTLFDKTKKPVQFPFGFGLSYTAFSLSDPKTEKTGSGVTVAVTVRNTGDRPGDAVVQVYASSRGAKYDRPVRLLKGFCRVRLAAGETKTVAVPVDAEDLRFWSEEQKSFVRDPVYAFSVTENGRDLLPAGSIAFGDNGHEGKGP